MLKVFENQMFGVFGLNRVEICNAWKVCMVYSTQSIVRAKSSNVSFIKGGENKKCMQYFHSIIPRKGNT